MSDEASAELLARWRGGDERAADELVRRYTASLIALARRQLAAKLARRIDPEDVVQSAYRSFFTGAREGAFTLQRSGDLWRLLVGITLNKLHHQVRHHTAGKRSVEREQGFGAESSLLFIQPETFARAPAPAEAAALTDELQHVLKDLTPLHRRMVELRLQGLPVDQIAADTGRSQRLVRWVFEQLKNRLEKRYQEVIPA